MLSNKLNLTEDSLEVYFRSKKFPKKHEEFIKKAYNSQIEFEKKINSMQVKAFEKL